MAVCNEIADYEWLTSDAACALAAELAANNVPLHSQVGRLRNQLSPARTHLVLELVELRRRAAAKFALASRMFFTPLALEQATDQWIAAYKAERFNILRAGLSLSNAPTVADFCCGIGGDLLALSARAGPSSAPTIGIDLNPIAAHLAAANARAVLNRDIEVRSDNVADFDLDGISAWHIDPDRRPTGQRTISLTGSSPNLATIERLLAAMPHAAIKLAPAGNVPPEWTERCELEWISRDRECRQLVVWHGALAQSPGLHRATILLPAACGLAPRSIVGAPNVTPPTIEKVDRFIFDTDPAIRAARLTGALAAEHDLRALPASEPGRPRSRSTSTTSSTYLTGPTAITDAALSCFEVTEVLPLRQRHLADYLHERNVGRLEIKTRGVKLDPHEFRRDLRLRGDASATLLVTYLTGQQTAILAKRLSGTP